MKRPPLAMKRADDNDTTRHDRAEQGRHGVPGRNHETPGNGCKVSFTSKVGAFLLSSSGNHPCVDP